MKKEITTVITTEYKFLLEGYKPVKRIKLGNNTFFTYTPFKFEGYSFNINEENIINFGCQRKSIKDVKHVLQHIKGEGVDTELWLISESGKQLIKKSDVIEESDNYYITRSNNILEKTKVHGEKEFAVPSNGLNRTNGRWLYKGYYLGKTDEDTIKKLQYILDTMSNLKRAMLECEK